MALSLFKNRNFDISIVKLHHDVRHDRRGSRTCPRTLQIVDDLNATAAGYLVAPMNAAWFAARCCRATS